MAGQVYAQLIGTGGGLAFGLSSTERQWNVLVDEISGLPLSDVMKDMDVNQFCGSVVAGHGGCMIRVINTNTGKIKMIGELPVATEEEVQDVEIPFTVEEYDTLQGFPVAVPT